MDQLKLTQKEWHLLSVAYQIFVDESPQEDETIVQHRQELAERVAQFSVRVMGGKHDVVVQIEQEK